MSVSWPDRPVSKSEARAEIVKHAWTIDDPGSSEHGHTVIHSRLNGIGADHSLEGALARVEEAVQICWITSPLGHDLAVITVDETGHQRVYCYDIVRPERR